MYMTTVSPSVPSCSVTGLSRCTRAFHMTRRADASHLDRISRRARAAKTLWSAENTAPGITQQTNSGILYTANTARLSVNIWNAYVLSYSQE